MDVGVPGAPEKTLTQLHSSNSYLYIYARVNWIRDFGRTVLAIGGKQVVDLQNEGAVDFA